MRPDDLPPPEELAARPALLLAELEHHVGAPQSAAWCADLLGGADPGALAGVLSYLAGRAARAFLDGSWPGYWSRVWGARGLRYVWDDACAPVVVAGLEDEAWRVAEMCVKVAGLREIGAAGDAAAGLSGHGLPRVREAAIRALGAIGDTEHVSAVEFALTDAEPAVRKVAARSMTRLRARLDLR